MRWCLRPGGGVCWRAAILVIVAVAVTASCVESELEIWSAELSQDEMRLRLTIQSCHAELDVDVTESSDDVVVAAVDGGAPLFRMGGDDCQDIYVLELAEPFSDRELIDRNRGVTVPVTRWLPDELPPWPYDRSRFTEAEYLAALEAMVGCIEEADPQMDAWIHQDLDWRVIRWVRPTDEPSNIAGVRVHEACKQEHLDPLTSEDS